MDTSLIAAITSVVISLSSLCLIIILLRRQKLQTEKTAVSFEKLDKLLIERFAVSDDKHEKAMDASATKLLDNQDIQTKKVVNAINVSQVQQLKAIDDSRQAVIDTLNDPFDKLKS